MSASIIKIISKDQTKLECLNYTKTHPVHHALFENNETYFLESDADQQIIINLAFSCPVKIHHLVLRAFKDKTRPLLIKLFANSKPLGFQECEGDEATQEIELKDSDFLGETVLKFVKFQNIKTLTIFIADNGGAEKTRLIKLGLYGNPEKDTDVFLLFIGNFVRFPF